MENMKGRPSFIPREVFRTWMKPVHLNKYVEIAGILPASFIARELRLGRPVRSMLIGGISHYRLLDVIARARAQAVSIEPPESQRISMTIEQLRQEQALIETSLDHQKHLLGLSRASMALTGRVMLQEAEIVKGAAPYKPTCGVYFLIKSERVMYVGQSASIETRLRDHAGRFDFDSFSFIEARMQDLDKLESLYIHLLRPEWNG